MARSRGSKCRRSGCRLCKPYRRADHGMSNRPDRFAVSTRRRLQATAEDGWEDDYPTCDGCAFCAPWLFDAEAA